MRTTHFCNNNTNNNQPGKGKQYDAPPGRSKSEISKSDKKGMQLIQQTSPLIINKNFHYTFNSSNMDIIQIGSGDVIPPLASALKKKSNRHITIQQMRGKKELVNNLKGSSKGGSERAENTPKFNRKVLRRTKPKTQILPQINVIPTKSEAGPFEFFNTGGKVDDEECNIEEGLRLQAKRTQLLGEELMKEKAKLGVASLKRLDLREGISLNEDIDELQAKNPYAYKGFSRMVGGMNGGKNGLKSRNLTLNTVERASAVSNLSNLLEKNEVKVPRQKVRRKGSASLDTRQPSVVKQRRGSQCPPRFSACHIFRTSIDPAHQEEIASEIANNLEIVRSQQNLPEFENETPTNKNHQQEQHQHPVIQSKKKGDGDESDKSIQNPPSPNFQCKDLPLEKNLNGQNAILDQSNQVKNLKNQPKTTKVGKKYKFPLLKKSTTIENSIRKSLKEFEETGQISPHKTSIQSPGLASEDENKLSSLEKILTKKKEAQKSSGVMIQKLKTLKGKNTMKGVLKNKLRLKNKKLLRIKNKLLMYNTVLNMFTSTRESNNLRDERKFQLSIFDFITFYIPWHKGAKKRIFMKVSQKSEEKIQKWSLFSGKFIRLKKSIMWVDWLSITSNLILNRQKL